MAAETDQLVAGLHEHVIVCLKRRERWRLFKALCLLVMGLLALLPGIMAMACFVWMGAFLAGHEIPWLWASIFAVPLALPLMFWAEALTRDSGIVDRPMEFSEADVTVGSVLFWLVLEGGCPAGMHVNPYATEEWALAAATIVLWGSSRVRRALHRFMVSQRLAVVNRAMAQELLFRLMTLHEGTEISKLSRSGEAQADLLAGIAYLVFYEWVDVSKDAKRVWVDSEQRGILKS